MNPKEVEGEKKVPIAVFITLILLGIMVAGATYQFYLSYGDLRRATYNAFITVLHLNIPENIEHGGIIFLFSVFGALFEIYLLIVLIELIYYGKLRRSLRGVRVMDKIKKMNGHYIICGGGRVGESVAEELEKEGKQYVIIEEDPERYEELISKGLNVIEGNSLEEEFLEMAGIKKAAVVICALGQDGENLLNILLAKDLNHNIKVVTRLNEKEYFNKFKNAGADEIIMPAIIGGKIMAKTAEKLLGE